VFSQEKLFLGEATGLFYEDVLDAAHTIRVGSGKGNS
jgi:hypothetical protein